MSKTDDQNVLVIDVGSGTQDILLYQPGKNIENCPKFIVPSRTQIVAFQIRQATAQGRDLFLHGHLMGGGACGLALRQHLKAGFKAYATLETALTFHDDLTRVKKMGVIITPEAPAGAERIWLGDLDILSLRQALGAFGLELPSKYAIALQDHGYSEQESNRTVRFRLWKEFILNGGNLDTLIFKDKIPEVYTRMRALREIEPQCVVTDTGTAAILGILTDPNVQGYLERGILALNIGNSHTVGAAIRGNRVYGIFEQHTSAFDLASLQALVQRFQNASLTHEEVFEAGGHGVAMHPEMKAGWDFVAVAGPRRDMVKPLHWYEVAPYGDMMLTGCFGLLKGLHII
ncbi:DUF1786 domain-containing protein [Desulfitobacterium metallireducens]|uniref:Pyruvate formate lyase-activating protein n=1 Tax=Desulfitobacterium metallireducens DSM 15288 TaxID=871968 RepID=W0EAF3_9FIRM|nr:DUF1786 domain-containing protein [Desulfitobacterium metallireducens]AHF06046.1 hypothetical protein DESME_02450 [Desulfitobacterium metallireducens DSM 15288]